MLDQPAFLQAGKGSLQIQVGKHIVPFQDALFDRRIHLRFAQLPVEILVKGQRGFKRRCV